MLFCGICHTDVHFALNHLGGAKYPIVPGHELVGKVTEVGKNTLAKATEIMKALWWRNNWIEKKGFCGFEIKNFPEMTISEAIYGK